MSWRTQFIISLALCIFLIAAYSWMSTEPRMFFAATSMAAVGASVGISAVKMFQEK